jgi:hypothetical protein
MAGAARPPPSHPGRFRSGIGRPRALTARRRRRRAPPARAPSATHPHLRCRRAEPPRWPEPSSIGIYDRHGGGGNPAGHTQDRAPLGKRGEAAVHARDARRSPSFPRPLRLVARQRPKPGMPGYEFPYLDQGSARSLECLVTSFPTWIKRRAPAGCARRPPAAVLAASPAECMGECGQPHGCVGATRYSPARRVQIRGRVQPYQVAPRGRPQRPRPPGGAPPPIGKVGRCPLWTGSWSSSRCWWRCSR